VRDLILLGALLSVFPLILRAPQIGILTWIWVTLMNPQREVYGFLASFQLNLYIAIITIFAWIASREKKFAPMNPVTVLLFLFGFWTCVSTYYALQRSFSFDLWERTMKTFILLFAMVAISNNKARIQAVVWMIVLSLGYVGVKGGGFVIATGGHHHVYGPEGSKTRADNDIFALIRLVPDDKIASLPFIYFDCGTEDPFVEVNREFAALLAEKKVPHEFRELPGKHEWPYWDQQVQEFLRVASRKLAYRVTKN